MAFLRSRRECGKLAAVRESKKKYRGPPEIWEKRGRKEFIGRIYMRDAKPPHLCRKSKGKKNFLAAKFCTFGTWGWET